MTLDCSIMNIAVTCEPVEPLRLRAEALATRLGLAFCEEPVSAAGEFDFLLKFDDKGLCLKQSGTAAPGPVRVDFVTGKQAWRQQHGGGKGQLIARALGLHKGACPEVLDATAGLGGDSFVLAGLGCRVTLLEQSAVVAALLEDGLQRLALSASPQLQAIAARMQLEAPIRAEDYLPRVPGFQAIYLDPMFGSGAGKAAVKKEMQVLRQWFVLGGEDVQIGDEAQLLQLAMERARYRVVVKRHRQAPAIKGPAPSYQLGGKSTRYDIYSLRRYS